ncbi:hypothetical protein TSUD_129270 [Trifolium subterraneum]|uniref:Uncharacterized protein n=1 Tax=Trifolium subterraneum TaxID=3900 RepID=A0A1B5Z896_TRISU|nr:hypothetical protein TSUD_129270 [Trifolium subterraneum]
MKLRLKFSIYPTVYRCTSGQQFGHIVTGAVNRMHAAAEGCVHGNTVGRSCSMTAESSADTTFYFNYKPQAMKKINLLLHNINGNRKFKLIRNNANSPQKLISIFMQHHLSFQIN